MYPRVVMVNRRMLFRLFRPFLAIIVNYRWHFRPRQIRVAGFVSVSYFVCFHSCVHVNEGSVDGLGPYRIGNFTKQNADSKIRRRFL